MLKKLMADNDIKNIDLAEAIGKSPEYLSQITGGHICPADVASEIVQALRRMLPRPRPKLTVGTLFELADTKRRYKVKLNDAD